MRAVKLRSHETFKTYPLALWLSQASLAGNTTAVGAKAASIQSGSSPWPLLMSALMGCLGVSVVWLGGIASLEPTAAQVRKPLHTIGEPRASYKKQPVSAPLALCVCELCNPLTERLPCE